MRPAGELVRIAQVAGELHYDESPVLGASLALTSPCPCFVYPLSS